ncbi:MAG TPA: 4-hydroxybenzoate octaprenyltransferase [Bacteroidales bacterium]|nr:MAG: 4-hydroxybenzoate octaprenyltransferase [Bacteroidetes bacterium GWF2_33_38]OFY75667.1 MAG: 4-hydroxybenzoate octaprenyltransferase [Bacteroidetes bacterium RIFOXYA12_FULL_33_9]OFY89625.1 MAG: 4-hydroxybenzoate octaprenyltransferase [Bacteroidetes bacterium RIFOXYA2_FULL_33_7]HBF89330.1 4-hydroxybenzoate octaprenyltransferase [Bacteroidales bacterium]
MHENKIKSYLSLVKFSHTIFALPFAFIGFFLATQKYNFEFKWSLLGLVVLCMIFARNAAMGFNRLIDREIDLKNTRTANREIPSGKIQIASARLFIIVNAIFFVASTYFINPLCFYLSPIALLIILGYSFTKKITVLCHFILGLGLSLAPIGAFIAVTGEFKLLPMLFSIVVLFWVSGFDIIYALQDESFDKVENLKSIPVLFGKKRALLLSRLLHLIVVLFIGLIGLFDLGNFYWLGAFIFSILLMYQHTIVKVNDLSKLNLAFFTANGIASVIFGIFVILGLLVR